MKQQLFCLRLFLILCNITTIVYAQQDTATLDRDVFSTRWETTKETRKGTFGFTPYKPVYFLFGNYTSNINETPKSINLKYQVPDSNAFDLDPVEFKFQISFKSKVLQGFLWGYGDMWMAYSQTSRWQIYNGRNSRAFRETNYEPEIILNFPANLWLPLFKLRMYGIAFNHQSNGRETPISRSWNRIIYHVGFDRKQTEVRLRMWHRIADIDDENPEITKYLGTADVLIATSIKGHQIAIQARQPLQPTLKRGSIQVDWSMPISRQLKTNLQFFHGYGESLIDYNHKQTTIGLGISLINWL